MVAASADYTVAQVTGAAPIASPTFTGTITFPITGATQCLQVNTSGVLSGTGTACGAGGGGGNVTGPGSSTVNDVAAFNNTGGSLLLDTGILYTNLVTLAGIQTLSNKTFVAPVLGAATATSLSTAGLTLTGFSTGCLTNTSGVVSSTGSPCFSPSGVATGFHTGMDLRSSATTRISHSSMLPVLQPFNSGWRAVVVRVKFHSVSRVQDV